MTQFKTHEPAITKAAMTAVSMRFGTASVSENPAASYFAGSTSGNIEANCMLTTRSICRSI